MADINLIPQEERANARAELIQKRLQFSSVGFLVFTAVLTILTLLFFAMFASKRAQLVAEIEDNSSKINRLKAQEELIVVVKDKASAADTIISSRIDFPVIFGKFSSLVPQNIYFTDIRVATGKIVISGKAKTSSDVAGLASSLVSASGAEIVSDVSIDSLSSDDAGIYSFVASAKIVGAEPAKPVAATAPGAAADEGDLTK
jgi:hypothetical protein